MTIIADFMGQDHDRLDGIFSEFQAVKGSDLGKAKHFFSEFKRGLQRHIVWEEEILFPVFEQKTGMLEVGPTAVMRLEHKVIQQALAGIHEKIRQGNCESEIEEASLLATLSQHNEKEENILYPSIDRLVTPEEGQEILRKVREYPQTASHECCA